MTRTMAITGVGGFIGSSLAERALELGWAVRGLELDEAAAQRVRELGVAVVVGDLLDDAACAEACAGADVLVHTAAVVAEDGAMELFERVNVQGSKSVAEAARAAGVGRMVHVSSIMVYGFEAPDGVGEGGPFYEGTNPYCATKLGSERAVMPLHDPGTFDVVIIRPGDVWGPRSRPWTERPMELMRKRLFVLPDGGRGILDLVYIDNLVDALMLACDTEHTGEAFTITDGAPMEAREFFGMYAQKVGLRRIPTAPVGLLRVAFGILDWTCRALGIESPASPAALEFINKRHHHSIEKAQKVLGYEPRVGVSEGMARI